MLENLVNTLISIENTEKENNIFSEAVDFGVVINQLDNKDPDGEIITAPSQQASTARPFADVIASLNIPENMSQDEKDRYITSVIDHEFYNKHANGKYLVMNEKDFNTFNSCIDRCNCSNEIAGGDRALMMKLVIALLKAIPGASSDNPCDANTKAAVDGAYQVLTDRIPQYDDKISQRDNILNELNEMVKYLI